LIAGADEARTRARARGMRMRMWTSKIEREEE
jgi:hypothetical protein